MWLILGKGNDYGESSHIYDPIRPSQIVPGAERYVDDAHSHSGFRAALPYFIAAYKAGHSKVGPPEEDFAVAWYRTTPAACGHDGGKYRVTMGLTRASNSHAYTGTVLTANLLTSGNRYRLGSGWVSDSQSRCPGCHLSAGFHEGARHRSR